MQTDIEVRSLEVRTQLTKSGKSLDWQKVGMVQGDDFPVVFEVFLPEGKPLSMGKHRLDLKFKADQWGSLVVDTFNCRVMPGIGK